MVPFRVIQCEKDNATRTTTYLLFQRQGLGTGKRHWILCGMGGQEERGETRRRVARNRGTVVYTAATTVQARLQALYTELAVQRVAIT